MRVATFLALATLVTATVSGCKCGRDKHADRASAATSVGDKLLKEFAGSYKATAPEQTGLKKFELTASVTSVRLFEGRVMNVWAYNGQVPGPTLRVRLGDKVRIEFTNKLPQPTTIHFHGVRVPNAMDGVPGVTQPHVLVSSARTRQRAGGVYR